MNIVQLVKCRVCDLNLPAWKDCKRCRYCGDSFHFDCFEVHKHECRERKAVIARKSERGDQ